MTAEFDSGRPCLSPFRPCPQAARSLRGKKNRKNRPPFGGSRFGYSRQTPLGTPRGTRVPRVRERYCSLFPVQRPRYDPGGHDPPDAVPGKIRYGSNRFSVRFCALLSVDCFLLFYGCFFQSHFRRNISSFNISAFVYRPGTPGKKMTSCCSPICNRRSLIHHIDPDGTAFCGKAFRNVLK